MVEDTLKSIDKRLDAIVKLLAENAVQGMGKKEAIIKLGNLGLEYDAIGKMVGVSSKTVANRLSEYRKKGGTMNKKRKKLEKTK